ncbi:NAD-dependent epimerase/dehydratase family protein [Nesterenkonia sp. HG001]|uniref:NAD-dependent epimerase/dehydratase family protein n=1 Tax=Nesterenkonia sp. HG001 TaxID=2983207 RepID=UPI002AC5CD7E|nr:NAD-dependent epimerase/dehydratase family protein [Nesterenkonia sp. HG001]MDZ5078798.1 NAD-dependent epimerase/dehydratase family protein [Nesterenkonia sp. HG001]
MRIAVVGATGNAGTAVLRELHLRPEVTSVIGIARRLPDTDTEPYSHPEWATIDIQFPESRESLAQAFQDADAVIHLAWLIQPNSERELLRRVNVDGTRHVLEAAAEAGVERIAVASSVGAYSPVDDDEPRREDWPTEGIPGSHYSVDKAAQERVLDEFETAHPGIALARLRPGLIFQGCAGSEIQRYFAGRWAPVQVLDAVRPPVVPLPRGVRAQAVHAADVASAYAEAVIRGAHGPFNIAADDLLDAQRLAQIVSGGRGRAVVLPSRPLRTAMRAAHRARLLPADEGWLDMGMKAPIMDTSRAREELGWRPRRSAADAAESLLQGMAQGEGAASLPMRPRSGPRVDPTPLPTRDHQLPRDLDADLLRQYMADHLTGATAGVERIEAMAEAYSDTPVFPELSKVAEEIRREHTFLQKLMASQDFPRPGASSALAWVGEKAARLKPYGRAPLNRSPSELLLECELMSSAITAKMHGWLVLQEHAEELGMDEAVFAQLVEDAEEQLTTLREAHRHVRERAFRNRPDALPE